MSISSQFRLLFLVMLAAIAVNPTITKAQYTDSECLTLLKQRNQETGKGSYKKMISLERRYLTYCREGMTVADYADALLGLAFALNNDNQHGEALAVANRCLQVNSSDLACAYEKAFALHDLGRIPEAKDALQKSLSLPAITESDVKVKRNIQKFLAQIIFADTNNGPNSPPADGPSQKKSGERYGTGFYVTATGYVVTNHHVGGTCTSVQTSDGTKLNFIGSDKSADLALLQAVGKISKVSAPSVRLMPW